MLARKVFRNVIYNSSSVFIGNVVGVIVTIYVARALKPELFGIYSLALSIAFLLLTFTDLGVNATLIRYVAHAYGLGDYELVRGYIRGLSKLKVLLVLVVSIILFTSSDVLSVHVFHKSSLSVPLKITSLFILFFSLSGLLNAIFNAFNNFKANLVKSVVYEFSRLFFIILFISIGLSVVGALLGFVIASFLALVVLLMLLLKNHRSFVFGNAKSIEWKRVVRFTSYLTIGSISWIVFAYIDSIMIGMLLPAEYLGYYRAAYTIVIAIVGVVSVGSVLFPVFTQLKESDLKRAFNMAFKYNAILSFPAAFGLPLIAEPFVRIVYGSEYLPALSVLYVLSLLLLRSTDFFAQIFNAKEKPQYPVYVNACSMILNIGLNYILILRYGMIGAAIATVIANFVDWVTLGYLCNRFFGIHPKVEYIVKPIFASVVMVFVITCFKPHTLLDGFLIILTGALVYFCVLFAIKGLMREDIDYLMSIFSKNI